MSKYTTEVRFICESNSGFTTEELLNKTPDEIITAARENIFTFNWPAYNNYWKVQIESFILKKYYTREIAFETVGLWKLKLNTRLNEIATKYNYIIGWLETHNDINTLFNNIDVVSTSERTDNLKTHVSGDSKDKYSDTPQGPLSQIDNGAYLSDYRNVTSISDQANTGNQNYYSTEKGYRGSKTAAELFIDSYMDNMDEFDVVSRMADECSDLFFGLW